MAVQTTTNLSNSVRTQYVAQYVRAAMRQRLYDQFAIPYPGLSVSEAIRGSSVQYNFLSDLEPVTAVISQTADVTPVTLTDATTSASPTSRGNAIQWAEGLDIQAYTNYGEERFQKIGENMMESVDLIAVDKCVNGDWVYRYVARASLDAGTSNHRASDALFSRAHTMLQSMNIPGYTDANGLPNWACILRPEAFYDIREGGNVDSIGLYQDAGIHLNFELGKIGPFRLIVSPRAHVFWGAGVANTTAISDTLGAAVTALDKTYTASAGTSMAAGQWHVVGSVESTTTLYPTTERVYVKSVSGTTISILGEGANGGFRFAHASGAAVINNDSVYTLVFGGPASLVKVFAPSVGEYGMTVGPKVSGLLDQFASLGWKWYGAYNRLVESRILRMEVSTSLEA